MKVDWPKACRGWMNYVSGSLVVMSLQGLGLKRESQIDLIQRERNRMQKT